ncbi:hypothetical protein HF086_006370 [Spodoptera exigua]|uniref:PX domain-containing protein n=1 Tax=Spodoptera exigua TaxID=7107 RepID=A0A922SBK1_SPOEX|nr:hypothetical protein HF086_006370 [Spodoptera exigua]
MSAQNSPVKASRSPSVIETVQDYDSQDTLLKHVDISIVESEKRANGTLHVRDHYTVYLIDLKVTDPDYKLVQSKISTIWRRYTEFEQIHDYLLVTYPHVLYAWRKSDTTDPEFVERRRAGLENFLLRVASHPRLCFDDQFINFLQQEHGWRETITDSGIQPTYLYPSLLSKIIEKNYALCKLHANYGKLFSEWSVIEKEMGDGLQKAGHYFDSVAEDEEQLADQLKEYLFYASALQQLCTNHEMLQRALENAQDTLNNRISERSRAAAGKSGLMSRLFGTTDPDIVRDQTTRALDSKIVSDKDAIEKAKIDLEEFTKKAQVEIEYFQKQKDKDLHESLVSFITLQVKAAKKNLQAWTQIKECLQNMP